MEAIRNWLISLLSPQPRSAQGIVLSAGLGTRLRPATYHTPKPAVPFVNRPTALHSVASLGAAGIHEIGANSHHLPEAMEAALAPAQEAGFQLTLSREEGEILGTGGGLREIWKKMDPNKRVVLCHGDVVLGAQLGPILEAHIASALDLTLVLKLRDPRSSLRGVFTDERGLVSQLLSGRSPDAVEPLVEHAFTGVHVIEPSILKEIPASGASCLVSEVYPRLMNQGLRIGAYLTTAFFADLGTPERFLEAQRAVLDHPDRLPSSHSEAIGPEVTIEEGANLIAPLRLEGPIRVRRGATVGPYVVARGEVDFKANAAVSHAAIWGEGEINSSHHKALIPLPYPQEEN